MNDAIDYFEGADEPVIIEPVTLARLTQLAEEAQRLEKEIGERSVALAELQDAHKRIVRDVLPSAMDQLGMKSFALSDGSKIDVKEHVQASITEEHKIRAFAWLTEHEFDGIIKTKVQSEFGKGEIEAAREAVTALEKSGFVATLDQNVHNSTLKAFVKERLAEGDDIPLDVFGVFEFKEAKINRPKEKKARQTRR